MARISGDNFEASVNESFTGLKAWPLWLNLKDTNQFHPFDIAVTDGKPHFIIAETTLILKGDLDTDLICEGQIVQSFGWFTKDENWDITNIKLSKRLYKDKYDALVGGYSSMQQWLNLTRQRTKALLNEN